MTDEMLALAQRNAAEAGATNVEFLKGTIEAIPLPADSRRRRHQQLRRSTSRRTSRPCSARSPASCGRAAGWASPTSSPRTASPPRSARSAGSYTGCIAGALSFSEFRAGLEAVGLADVQLTPTHDVADGMVSAIVKATKPADAAPLIDLDARAATCRWPSAGCCGGGGCC